MTNVNNELEKLFFNKIILEQGLCASDILVKGSFEAPGSTTLDLSDVRNDDKQYKTYLFFYNGGSSPLFYKLSMQDSDGYPYFVANGPTLDPLVNNEEYGTFELTSGTRITKVVVSSEFTNDTNIVGVFRVKNNDTPKSDKIRTYSVSEIMPGTSWDGTTTTTAQTSFDVTNIDSTNLLFNTYAEINLDSGKNYNIDNGAYFAVDAFSASGENLLNRTILVNKDNPVVRVLLPKHKRIHVVKFSTSFTNTNPTYVSVYQESVCSNGYPDFAFNETISNAFERTVDISGPCRDTSNHSNPCVMRAVNLSSTPLYLCWTLLDYNEVTLGFKDNHNSILIPAYEEVAIPIIADRSVKSIKLKNDFNGCTIHLSISFSMNCGRPQYTISKVHGDFTSFSDAVVAAYRTGNIDLLVSPGTYDVLSELGGDTGIVSEISYSRQTDFGLPIGNGIRIIGQSTSYIVANYLGSNTHTNSIFSLFWGMPSDFDLININIEASNIRYCVHDDPGSTGNFNHKFIDCNMFLDNSRNPNWSSYQCIGGGLTWDSTIYIHGGHYRSESGSENPLCISYHHPQSPWETWQPDLPSDYMNHFIVEDVFITGGVFALGGPESTRNSEFIVRGCSISSDPQYSNNWVLYSYNNTIL